MTPTKISAFWWGDHMAQTRAGFGANSTPRTLARTSLDVDTLVQRLDHP
jgi:hypothetical protein